MATTALAVPELLPDLLDFAFAPAQPTVARPRPNLLTCDILHPCTSPMAQILKARSDSAFILLFCINVHEFESLLTVFTPYHHITPLRGHNANGLGRPGSR